MALNKEQLFAELPEWFDKAHEWRGRLITYVGGSGVSLFSHEAVAKTAESASEVTMANWISLGGLVLVAIRLCFDIYVHIKKERHKRNLNDGPKTTDR